MLRFNTEKKYIIVCFYYLFFHHRFIIKLDFLSTQKKKILNTKSTKIEEEARTRACRLVVVLYSILIVRNSTTNPLRLIKKRSYQSLGSYSKLNVNDNKRKIQVGRVGRVI